MFTHVQMNKVNLEKTMPKNWNLFGKDCAKELEFIWKRLCQRIGIYLEKTMPKNWNLFGKGYAKELEFMRFSSKSYGFLVAKVLDLL